MQTDEVDRDMPDAPNAISIARDRIAELEVKLATKPERAERENDYLRGERERLRGQLDYVRNERN